MKIGYARVSTKDQNLDLQVADLKIYGCEKIFKEKVSAGRERAELKRMLSMLREGDSVVVWKLDRLGRSLKDLVDLIGLFKDKGVEFVSLMDGIDTSTAQGRFTFNIIASFAELEREMIRERVMAGLRRARENGRIGGRPGLSAAAKSKARFILFNNNENNKLPKNERKSIDQLVKESGVSRATYYRYLDFAQEEEYQKKNKTKPQ